MNSSTAVIDEDAVQNQIRLVLPGVVFMLRDIFPNYMFWRYVDEGDREIIALSCMQMIHQLLNLNLSKESSEETNSPICILYRASLYSLLFLDAGTALLRIVGSGENLSYLLNVMKILVNCEDFYGKVSLSIFNCILVLFTLKLDKRMVRRREECDTYLTHV